MLRSMGVDRLVRGKQVMKDLRHLRTEPVEILCHPVQVDESEALDACGDLISRLQFGPRSERRARLLYKPFWYSEARLPDTPGRRTHLSREIVVIMDGLTGVTRHREKKPQEPEPLAMSVKKESVYLPEVDEVKAKGLAKRFSQQLHVKESRKVHCTTDPKLVFRPVWLVENLRKGRYYLVDACTGYVARNLILPQKFTGR